MACRGFAEALDCNWKVSMLVTVGWVESNLDKVKTLVVVDTVENLKDSENDTDLVDDVPLVHRDHDTFHEQDGSRMRLML